MADIRIKIVLLPAADSEKQVVINGLTDAQAKVGAIDSRYWVDPLGKILVIAVPVIG